MTQQASIRYTRTDDGAEIADAVVGVGDPVAVAAGIVAAGGNVSLASESYMSLALGRVAPRTGRTAMGARRGESPL